MLFTCICLDDGKIFVGSGVGEQFGPRCHKGTVTLHFIFTYIQIHMLTVNLFCVKKSYRGTDFKF